MVDKIVEYTNNKRLDREANSTSEVRVRDYRETTRVEMLALFGALFLIAIKRENRADFTEFFNKNGTGLTILRANFSENRIRFLLRSLRFDSVNTRTQRSKTDKLAPIRDFLTDFISNSQRSYNIGEYATIDEMLVAFRGRCSFIQYMAKKPAKYGLKIYAMCDSQTYYTYNLEIYCGIQKDGPYVCSNKPFDLVKRLVKPLEKSNRNITTDNYFSSILLLTTVGLTFLGTLRKNKAEIPPPFVTENRNLVPGNYLFGCQDDKTLVSLVTKKKKVVLVLSTLHDTDTVDELTGKPIQIADYNSTKGGVDTVDLMCSRITTSRRTQRWPMNIFFRLLDIAGINSFRIFQMNNPFDKSIRRRYLYNLSLELMKENFKERAKLRTLPKDLSLFLESYREPTVHQPPLQTQPNQRAICHVCGSKKNHRTQLACKDCRKYVCKNHCTVTCNSCQENLDEDGDMN
nr:unnamed protein product [Callosobruchus chinensis]